MRSTTTGTLSTDGRYVYGIEGAGRNSSIIGLAARRGLGGAFEQEPGTDPFNTLFAYDAAAEGAIAWTVGTPRTAAPTARPAATPDSESSMTTHSAGPTSRAAIACR